jgi:hypothetical protein
MLLPILAPASASADVTYYSYKSIRNWNIPGGDTTVVFVFTVLFGATIWFVARSIWLKDPPAQRRNLILAAATFVPVVLLVLLYAQRS